MDFAGLRASTSFTELSGTIAAALVTTSDPRPASDAIEAALPVGPDGQRLKGAAFQTAKHVPIWDHFVKRKAITMRFVVLPEPHGKLRVWLGNGFAKRYLFDTKASNSGGDPAGHNGGACALLPHIPGWCSMRPNFTSFVEMEMPHA